MAQSSIQYGYSSGPSACYNVRSSSLYIQTEILLDLVSVSDFFIFQVITLHKKMGF